MYKYQKDRYICINKFDGCLRVCECVPHVKEWLTEPYTWP